MGKLMRRLLLLLLIVGAIGSGVWYFFGNRLATITGITSGTTSGTSTTAQSQSLTQVVTVTQGNIRATVSVVGQLDAPQSQEMRFDRLAGADYLLSLEVAAGNVVTAGQVLATLDSTPYEQALEQAQSDLQDAETKLSDLQTPPTQLDISKAELAIAQAEFALQKSQQAEDDLLHPDLDALQNDIAQAQLRLTQAKASLANLQTDTSNEDKLAKLRESGGDLGNEAARLGNESYRDSYYQDRLRLANEAVLNNQDAIKSIEIQRQIDLLNAQINVRKAQQNVVKSQTALSDAQSGADELAVALAKQSTAQATLDLAQARQDRADLDAGASATDLAAAQAAVTKQQQVVSEAQADLDATQLRAPFTGTVLQTNAVAGNRLSSSSTILTVANLKQLQVIASIDETTIRQIKSGQSVRITFDAFAGQNFSGEVLSVPLQGTLQGDVMVYDVPMSLVGAEKLPLLVGMTANVTIRVGEAKDALLLPKLAILSGKDGNQVLIPNRSDPLGAPQSVPVEVGLSDGVYTEILSGLNLGDQVVAQLPQSTSNNNRFPGGGGLFGGAVRVQGGNRIR